MTNTITRCSRERKEKDGKGVIVSGFLQETLVSKYIYLYMDCRMKGKRKEKEGKGTK